MIDIESERELVKGWGDNVRKICKYADELQSFGDRICPLTIYQDATANEICTTNGICRKRYAECFKKYFARKRQKEKNNEMGTP